MRDGYPEITHGLSPESVQPQAQRDTRRHNAGRSGREQRPPDTEESDQGRRDGHADGDGTKGQAQEHGAGVTA
jgi:hypothetical protein